MASVPQIGHRGLFRAIEIDRAPLESGSVTPVAVVAPGGSSPDPRSGASTAVAPAGLACRLSHDQSGLMPTPQLELGWKRPFPLERATRPLGPYSLEMVSLVRTLSVGRRHSQVVRHKALRQICGARTRRGTLCQAPLVRDRARCRRHGGLSTGPVTEEGKRKISDSQRARWKEWRRATRGGTSHVAATIADGATT